MTKMERMSREALSRVPSAARKLIVAAERSEEVARETRAHVRRQRMLSQRVAEDPLEMPETWRDDEPTQRTTTENKKSQ